MGRYFEELAEGEAIAGPSRLVTGADIDAFVNLSGDDNRLHTDDEFARAAGFKGRIAHGALVVSLATGLAWRTGVLDGTTIAFRSIDEWKFSLAVYPGDEITLRGKIGEKRAMPRAGGGLVRFDLELVNQEGQVVSSGALRMFMRLKSQTRS